MSDIRVADPDQLRRAAGSARPGDRLLLAPGVHVGGLWLENLHGAPGRPIVLAPADPTRPTVLQGGGECLHLSRVSHVEVRGFTLRGAGANGLNVDDGGDVARPSHHVVLRDLVVADVGPDGNRDGVKLSGVDDFLVTGCTLSRWGRGGSGIDMVGCHDGRIEECRFRDGGANAVQMKGGTARVAVRRCRFVDAGERGINVGGSTGFAFFRPPLSAVPAGKRHEAQAITVEGCTFLGGGAPVAFVGVDGATVRFNTFWRPGRWVVRILQETTDPSFVPCRDGVFADNVVVFRADAWAEGGVNVGPGTAPRSFRFARNVWYCEDRPERSAPRLPSVETDAVVGRDPLLRDPAGGDFGLRPGSPASGRGASAAPRPDPRER